MTNRRDIPQWCLGANDQFGTCAFVSCANHVILLGKGVMSDGEILNAAREIEGLNDQDPSTDRGENMEALFGYIQANGWPGDSTLTISEWSKVDLADVAATIAQRQACPSWLMLPMMADGSDFDFSDDAVFRGAAGGPAHAVCVVEADGRNLTMITWARPVTVSMSWAQAYFRCCYDVEWTDIA
jgi:hypothetical protein